MRNQETPVTFELPDGDHVELITWEFVLMKLNEEMNPIFNVMDVNNGHLKAIADKLEEFID